MVHSAEVLPLTVVADRSAEALPLTAVDRSAEALPLTAVDRLAEVPPCVAEVHSAEAADHSAEAVIVPEVDEALAEATATEDVVKIRTSAFIIL